MSVLQETDHEKNTAALMFWHIQGLHFMYSEVVSVLLPSEIQVQL